MAGERGTEQAPVFGPPFFERRVAKQMDTELAAEPLVAGGGESSVKGGYTCSETLKASESLGVCALETPQPAVPVYSGSTGGGSWVLVVRLLDEQTLNFTPIAHASRAASPCF